MAGIPRTPLSYAHWIKEDPVRRGLLYLGTENALYVSFNDGALWQPLQSNLPHAPVHDITVQEHFNDLVIATYGRGFWILDDITPLRQITPAVLQTDAYLFRPPVAWRFKWNKNTDTPLPPDEPTRPNPPDGVIISYYLGAGARGPVTLEIANVDGTVIRRYGSDDPAEPPVESPNMPDYWIRPAQKLLATPGLHRFVWDVRYAPPAVGSLGYAIAAVPYNTPKTPQGMWTMPGQYQVRLTVGSRTERQPVQVKLDPRVRTSVVDLTLQFKLSKAIDDALRALATARAGASPERLTAINAAAAPLGGLLATLQGADARPTAATEAAVAAALARVADVMAK